MTLTQYIQYVYISYHFQTLHKRKYLCPTDYDEGYFNWNCLSNRKPPADGSIWYTICGVPLENRGEYMTIITTLTVVAIVVFGNLHFGSSGDQVFNEKANKTVKTQTHKKKTK